MSTVDIFHLGDRAKNVESSPQFDKFNMVRIIVGEDEDENQLVYEAGSIESGGRCLEVTNPWGTQQMANDMLDTVKGYKYKPYTADGALLNPAAELGDAVYVKDVYSVINSAETTFSPIMSSTIGAVDSGDLDHEYPFETKANQEVARKFNNITTNFNVKLGEISTEISETYETKSDAGAQYQSLSSSIAQTASSITSSVAATYETKTAANTMKTELQTLITQTADGITSSVSATYEKKTDATAKLNEAKSYAVTQDNAVKTTLNTTISQTANSVKSTVAAAYTKYDSSGVSVNLYGYGSATSAGYKASEHTNEIYLNQNNGKYYKSNGTSWVLQGTLKLITDNLESKIEQTASEIKLEVAGQYLDAYPAWASGTEYQVGNIVRVETYNTSGTLTDIDFYRCKLAHTSSSSRKPPNSTYWESISTPTVQSTIDVNLDGITLYTEGSSTANSAKIELRRNGVEISGQTITMTNVVADSVSASNITTGTLNAVNIGMDESMSVYRTVNGDRKYCGELGGGYAAQPDPLGTDIYCPSIAMISEDTYSYVATSNGQYIQPAATSGGGYRGFAVMHTRSASIYTTSSVVESQHSQGTYIDYNPYAVMESNNGSYYVSFGVNGGLTTGISNVSDRRTKEDIDYDMTRYESLFHALRPCSFRFKNSNNLVHTGYVAQDVEAALDDSEIENSGLVTYHGEEARGYSEADKMLGLEYNEITPIHTHMIQQLIKRVNELEALIKS